MAAMDFADADDAVLVARDRELDTPRLDGAFRRLTGVHAGGHDFGPRHNPPRPRTGRDLSPDEEDVLIDAAFGMRERYEKAKAAVARGELDAIERRSWQRGLSAALILEDADDWLDVGTGRVLTQLALGDLFAFVCDDELLFPAWQFTDDPDQSTLNYLSWLVEAFDDDMHPTSILGFMTRPHPYTRIHGKPATPVEWLTAGRHVQPLLELLETRRLR
ncbi:hypothetical protein [Curtobacterium sp. VKM Ac-2887]|uniref:hypothetical protein n=1 Tax=Curtobacterium sp. VKM Ac-2887 TaxID=2783819 RepID=UPI00188CDC18|nr:hypothetical protein [Curtobacterium sp. VKM Ac-2887]MBF4586440.1 hypothetical protein [Curtobacterium sp. VKM Ac-2887]